MCYYLVVALVTGFSIGCWVVTWLLLGFLFKKGFIQSQSSFLLNMVVNLIVLPLF